MAILKTRFCIKRFCANEIIDGVTPQYMPYSALSLPNYNAT